MLDGVLARIEVAVPGLGDYNSGFSADFAGIGNWFTMFDDLQKRLSTAFGRFRARGVLTEANIAEGLSEVRTALLEADVNYNVVQEFMAKVNEKAVGSSLLKAVRPDQQVVKIVHDSMVEMMGPVDPSIRFEKSGPTILMLCGLQGSGKTTTTGKLAKMLLAQGRKPLMVAADLQRPAAVEQLKVIGQQLGVPVFSQENSNPVKVCQDALIEANRQGRDTILLDTAGRLHIDDDLMAELKQIEKKVKPHQVYFVCDALTGQDAVASAGAFNDALELDGVILTKLDGDARGGAALSVKQVTGVPIKFVGMGEKLDKLQAFDPERIVGQILGMGDIVGLVEAAQSAVNEEEAKRQQEKLAKGKFDLNDFRQQLTQMKKMGSVKDLMGMIPGMNQMAGQMEGVDADGEMKRIQGIIDSMTKDERKDPARIDISRRRRIAAGAGVDPSDVSGLVKQFDAMAAFVKQMSQMSMLDKIRAMTGLGKAGAFNPGAKLVAPKQGTGKRLTPKEKEKLRKEREREERKKRREMKEGKEKDGPQPGPPGK
jgi:signal recognition particle subunit SRP54